MARSAVGARRTFATFRACVVGSGPSGLYTAKYLQSKSSVEEMGDGVTEVHVDVVEAMPVPFGLVRFGVAPDHQDVKNVQHEFSDMFDDNADALKFFGNVTVGKDISVDELRDMYDAVILCCGASQDRLLGIPGEADSPVHGAREFVNWYNGHPDFADASSIFNFSHPNVVVVGNGNVAIDCARILTKSVDELAKSDISPKALEALSNSKVKRVILLGRRGHAQGAFTIKEVRELTKLEGVECIVHESDINAGSTKGSLAEIKKQRAKKRMHALLEKTAKAASESTGSGENRVVEFQFLKSPVSVESSSSGCARLVVERTELSGEAFAQSAKGTGETEQIECGMVLRSIGYKSEPIEDSVPFDEKRSVVKSDKGKISDGFYTSGWCKRGPTGIVGTNIIDAKETVAAIVGDVSSGRVSCKDGGALGSLLSERNVDFVTWSQYKRIDAAETKAGEASAPVRPRVKLDTCEEMLSVAHNNN